ncbi:MAG: esterase family protein [Planctomycetales bacterium]|nr:esterase family protein [Planctomycetales bacterium]
MNKLLLLLAGCLNLASAAYSQTGTVYDDLSLRSRILNEERKYAVYLPPDYNTSSRSYPVLYLLHGSGDDQSGWIQFGEVLRITDDAIRSGAATPMVIVMPNADQTHRGYTNHISEDFRYEDFFFEELVPHVEAKFRIKSEKRYRAVAGLSMGGNGSFVYGLRRPEMFSAACPLSAYAGPLSIEDLKESLKRRGEGDGVTEEQLQAYYERYSILQRIEKTPADQLRTVRWYIDCGDDDFLYEGNSLAHIAMRKRGVPHEYRVRDGGHAWSYWRSALPSVLEFVTDGFHQR